MKFRAVLTAMLLLASLMEGSAAFAQATVQPVRIQQLRQDIIVNRDGTNTITTSSRYQVLSAAAAMQVAQVPVRYDASTQDLEILEAFTEKTDGRKIPVDPANIITQRPAQASAFSPMYSASQQKTIIFPNVEVGDSMVYTSKLVERRAPIAGQFSLFHNFPTNVEVKEAVYSLTAPRSMALNVSSADMKQEEFLKGDTVTYRWSLSDVAPKTQSAPAIIDPNTGPHFAVSSFKDYDALAHAFAPLLNEKIAVTPEIQKQADAITGGISDRKEQASLLYDWVSQHVRYVAIEFGTGGFIPHDANWTLSNSFGDCKDQAVLYASLLKAKGIDSRLVLLNTINRYQFGAIPTGAEFNHVIVWLPDWDIYSDTTVGGLPFWMLPIADLGKPVLHLVETGPARHVTPVMGSGVASSDYKVVAQMGADGHFDVQGSTFAKGPWAATLRRLDASFMAVGPAVAARSLLQARGFSNATGTLTAFSARSEPGTFGINGAYHAGRAADGVNLLALASALQLLSRAGDGPAGPLFNTQIKEADDTMCYRAHQREDIQFRLLPGVHMPVLPSDVHVQTEHFEYGASWSNSGDGILLHREFNSDIGGPVCSGASRQEAAKVLSAIRQENSRVFRLGPSAEQAAKPN